MTGICRRLGHGVSLALPSVQPGTCLELPRHLLHAQHTAVIQHTT
jgi:hypothetical protein